MASLLAPASPFDRPSLAYTLLTQPVHLLLRLLSHALTSLRPATSRHRHPVRLVCISDTHSLNPGSIPSGDILIHAGDITAHGTPAELQAAIDTLSALPHPHKFIIAGNHDTYLDATSRATLPPSDQTPSQPLDWKSLTYLQHASHTLHLPRQNRTLHIHGSPQTPLPDPTFAFTYAPHQDAWHETLPPATDILITHTPPKHHLDLPSALGCAHLARETARIKPLVHIFGHVHAARSDFESWLTGARQRVVWGAGQRALERGLTRRARGCVWDVCNLALWWDVAGVLYYGLGAVLWERVWGGASGEAETLMVNAAMMWEGSGRLGHEAQVVDV
ncbi:hypothetical protein Q7P37_003548 [Cladosporium fusiforme]